VRVTKEKKKATRRKILAVASRMFRGEGFEETTTRDIALGAGVATGTVFNYFPTKESIVMSLVSEALGKARLDFESDVRSAKSLEESLFMLIATGLRRLKPFRAFLQPALEASMSPIASHSDGQDLRVGQLELVAAQIANRMDNPKDSPLVLQLYWTLHLGVLAFWVQDKSPKQEDTLALIDQSLKMYVGWLE